MTFSRDLPGERRPVSGQTRHFPFPGPILIWNLDDLRNGPTFAVNTDCFPSLIDIKTLLDGLSHLHHLGLLRILDP
jgi:hypothetical protein